MRKTLTAVCALTLSLLGGSAMAQDTVKIGIINAYSGQFADPGAQLDAGIKLYMQQHGDEVAGKKIEIIRKDVGGIAPDVAKRLAEELVVRDGVDILAGALLTPNALAMGDVSAEAEKFMVVMNATTPVIITKSPYMIRTSATASQINGNFGAWVAKQGVKQVYTMVTDYGPGIGSGAAFEEAFKAAGGEVVGQDRTPVVNPDFAPFVQRIAEAKPEALYVWVPGGTQPPALGKALAERGITAKNTKIYGQGELTDDAALEAMGETAAGIITAYHYNVHRDDPLNNEFVKAYRDANDGRDPDIYSIGAYDGMAAIYKALEATGGDASAAALIKAAKGMTWDSPRGPMGIDAETGDVVQTIWIREVQMVDGKPQNVIIDQIDNAR
ncbi:ABC transporter substrate-binding protein [Oricola nitratireducens]|uniref:ABC transporter substrate-binding protein n=1 Tax=Oricola nitratireducens TaxID=2775868 RepID=UPI001868BAD8|nr:ABC transporter substrate-binding protein [Oricola nitratireducens]